MDAFMASLVFFGFVFGGAIFGMYLRTRLPQSMTYSGPITLSDYQRFQWIREQLQKEGVHISFADRKLDSFWQAALEGFGAAARTRRGVCLRTPPATG